MTLVNRAPRSRMTMRAQFLSTVCLSSDFKIFKAHNVISGTGDLSTALGSQLRRLWSGGLIRLPIEMSPKGKPWRVRMFLSVWCADGMAMGDVCGTNTSFSKAINICNTCEDFDQRNALKKIPCSIMSCRCGDADHHSVGCPCHFRLRSHARDKRRPTPLSKTQMTSLGITTEKPGIHGIPGIRVATPGPKDSMHTLQEGRSAQLGAVTCWHVVASGLATKEQLQRQASSFDWTPGGPSTGFFTPTYLPDKIFVSTKVYQPDGTWKWGPHKDIKVPGSAVGVCTFTLMSTEFLRPFIPQGPVPSWLLAWQLHVAAFAMSLRFRFTYSDLLHLESLFVRSETIVSEYAPYRDLWIPKAHWVLHLAHDIYRWGPSRLLTTLLNEMKNAQFKHGAKRSNFANPVKSVAEFWAQQSDYQLQTLTAHPGVTSDHATVLVSAPAQHFADSQCARLLIAHSLVNPSTEISFMSELLLHRVSIRREDWVLLDAGVWSVLRVVRVNANASHHVLLRRVADAVQLDEFGAYYVDIMPCYLGSTDDELRFVSVTSACTMTGLWTIGSPSGRVYVIPKC